VRIVGRPRSKRPAGYDSQPVGGSRRPIPPEKSDFVRAPFSNRQPPGTSRFGIVLGSAAFAVAVDLGWAALRGYRWRFDVAELLGATMLAMALLGGAAGLVLSLVGRFAPRRFDAALIALAGIGPVVAILASRSRSGPLDCLPPMAVALVFGLAGWLVERRVPGGARPAPVALLLLAIVVPLVAVLPPRSLPHAPVRSGSTDGRPNVLLVVADALRSDRVGALRGGSSLTPNLDSLAARSSLFEHAVTSSNWSLPAHASLLTGLQTRSHGANLDGGGGTTHVEALLRDFPRIRSLDGRAVTLGELLRREGYETGAILANAGFVSRAFGLDQGFDTWNDTMPQAPLARPAGLTFAARLSIRWKALAIGNGQPFRSGREVTEEALRWLGSRGDRSFFLLLNYMDLHEPRVPRSGFRDRVPGGWPPPISVVKGAIRERRLEFDPETKARLDAVYDGCTAGFDTELGRLFRGLRRLGREDDTAIVVLSDHGEALGEHGNYAHGYEAWETDFGIPLIVHGPGQRVGRRIGGTVSITDVMPTLLELVGAAIPPDLDGDSLVDGARPLPVLGTAVPSHDGAGDYAYGHDLLYRDPWKLVRRSDGRVSLYDLSSDPAELRDLARAESGRVRGLLAELATARARTPLRFEGEGVVPSNETLERLRSLGYLGGAAGSTPVPPGSFERR
jgi:arylsulfatase A-like enzyme